MRAPGAGFFGTEYAALLPRFRGAAETRREVEWIVATLGLRPGARVLDAGCGTGRHARLLAARGLRVTGVDASPAMLREARRARPPRGLVLVRADLRRARLAPRFDALLALFNVVGYGGPRRDAALLVRLARALVPGGSLLLEQRDPAFDAGAEWGVSGWRTGAARVVQRVRWDARGRRLEVRWSVRAGGGAERLHAVRLHEYELEEWRAMLAAAGLRLRRAWSDLDRPFRRGRGPRLLLHAVAERGRGAPAAAR